MIIMGWIMLVTGVTALGALVLVLGATAWPLLAVAGLVGLTVSAVTWRLSDPARGAGRGRRGGAEGSHLAVQPRSRPGGPSVHPPKDLGLEGLSGGRTVGRRHLGAP
jgi:uncharacterized membrane protein